jgi:general secretion pathway protein J
LLELLVVLVVLGVLFASLVEGMRVGLLAWRTEARLAGTQDEFTVVDGVLRHLVQGMDPGSELNPAPFTADTTHMDFITVLPQAAGFAPERQMQAKLLVDAEHRLLLVWRPWLNAERLSTPPPPSETVLLHGVARVDLAFWRPGVGWLGAWRFPNLPALIRVRLRFVAGDPRRWPDIITAPVLRQ